MISIGKLATGQEGYYLDQAGGRIDGAAGVASGVEDYYLGGPEAAGTWVGAGARRTGLSGEVGRVALQRVLAGAHPRTGEPLRRWGKVPGFDVTFSAPKSVSVLFGISEPDVQGAIRRAHDRAVAEAFAYLEREAGVARRGRGGRQTIPTHGLIAGAFRHRTSRSGDPQLHTHVLVANLVLGLDGQWSTLDGRRLYTHARTAGFLYQAALRGQLTRTLGFGWTRVRRGVADVEGVPAGVVRAFSRRRAEIEEALDQRGASTARAAQVAALDTRQAKHYGVTPERLAPEWRERAADLGLTLAEARSLLGRAAVQEPDDGTLSRVRGALAGAGGLTAQRSSFTRRDVVQALCEQLPVGATIADVEREADGFLSSGHAIPLVAGDVSADGGERMYSTPELLTLEARILESAAAGRGAGAGVASHEAVDAAVVSRPALAPEQVTMVRRLTRDGDRLAIVVGKAGSGKTYALAAAREAWAASGVPVIGTAVARRAAHELERGAGISATSVAALLADLEAGGERGLRRGTVVVVDEAAMLPTRQLAKLLDFVERADGKLVLVGDHHQLPELRAGGVFRGLAIRGNAIELVENRRQQEAWEHAATDLLRDGAGAAAIELYREHERLVVDDDAERVLRQLVADWYATGDPTGTVMIAHRRADVAQLNGRARAVMRQAARLGAAELELPGGRFTEGDLVVLKRNDRRLGVRNGERGTITALDHATGTMTVDLGDRQVHLDERFLVARGANDEPTIRHGYAITAYVAQGMTCRQALILGTDSLYREWGYTSMTRGQEANRLYVISAEPAERDEYAPAEDRTAEPIEEVIAALETSRAQAMGHDAAGHHEMMRVTTDALVARLREAQRSAGPTARPVDRRASRLAEQISEAEGLLAAAREQCQRIEQLQPRRWRSRPNPTLEMARINHQLAANRLDRLRSEELPLTPEKPRASGVDNAHVAALRDELQRRLRIALRTGANDVRDHLKAAIGPRPSDIARLDQWARLAARVEAYRAEFTMCDPRDALGPPPSECEQRDLWDDLMRDVERWLLVEATRARTVATRTRDGRALTG